MKTPTVNGNNDINNKPKDTHLPWPTLKQKEAIIATYNPSDEA